MVWDWQGGLLPDRFWPVELGTPQFGLLTYFDGNAPHSGRLAEPQDFLNAAAIPAPGIAKLAWLSERRNRGRLSAST